MIRIVTIDGDTPDLSASGNPDDAEYQAPPHKNAAGFIHHEEVFPLDGKSRKFRFVPTLAWNKNCYITIIKQLRNGEDKVTHYRPPFVDEDGNPELPLIDLHCSPYFIVSKTYWALTVKDAKLPDYVSNEERQIREIGEIMTGKTAPKDDAIPAPN
ncbi:hypothetical protein HDZ31DRAFT_68651 [Schizophyllum fasciatum]